MNSTFGPSGISKTAFRERLRPHHAILTTGILLAAVAASLVLAVAVGPSLSGESAGVLHNNHDAAGSGIIQPGDLVSVDITTLLNGKVWKTTHPYIGELLQFQLSGGNRTDFDLSIFTPANFTAGEEVANNPVLTALARELPGRRIGDHFEFSVMEPFGPASEVRHLDIPRWWGPFPRDTTWSREAFNASFGAPQIGMSVPTNKLFNSTVTAVDATQVMTTSQAQAGEVAVLPFFNSFLRVFEGEGNTLKFRVDPVQNISFNVQEGRKYFGLAPGHYAVTEITEDTISYLHHPKWSPYLPGLNFDLIVDIRPSGYSWTPITSPPTTLPAGQTTADGEPA